MTINVNSYTDQSWNLLAWREKFWCIYSNKWLYLKNDFTLVKYNYSDKNLLGRRWHNSWHDIKSNNKLLNGNSQAFPY